MSLFPNLEILGVRTSTLSFWGDNSTQNTLQTMHHLVVGVCRGHSLSHIRRCRLEWCHFERSLQNGEYSAELGLEELLKEGYAVKNWLCPSKTFIFSPPLGRSPLSPWDVLLDKSVIVYMGALGHCRESILQRDIQRGPWVMWSQLDLWRGWRLRSAMCVDNHVYITNPPIKRLDAKASVSFPGWQCSVNVRTINRSKATKQRCG